MHHNHEEWFWERYHSDGQVLCACSALERACSLPFTLPLVCLFQSPTNIFHSDFGSRYTPWGSTGAGGTSQGRGSAGQPRAGNTCARFLAEGVPPLSSLSVSLSSLSYAVQAQKPFVRQCFLITVVPLFPLPWLSTGRSREWCVWCVWGVCARGCLSSVPSHSSPFLPCAVWYSV